MNADKLATTVAKGRNNFIWKRGVLGWGLGTAVLWSILMQVISPQEPLWLRPLIAVILFPIGGYVWGVWAWKLAEKKYSDSENSSDVG